MSSERPGSPRSGAITNGQRESADRGNFSRPTGAMNVPRPPANNIGGGNQNMNAPHRSEAPMNTPRSGAAEHSAPVSRPPASERNVAPPANNNGRGEQRSPQPRNFSQSDGGRSMNVPRPTGPVRQASNQSYDYRGSQGNRGYSAPERSSSSQASRSYGSYGGGQQRSYPSSPRYSAPSMSGNSQRSGPSPSYRSAPSSSSHSGYSGHSGGGGGGNARAHGGRG